MSALICPVCGGELIKIERTYKCDSNHSFDMARQGYVNLLMNNSSSSRRHGDDKLMISARRDFLNRGYYLPLRDAVVRAVTALSIPDPVIVDSGCGDCWYTAAVHEAAGGEVIGVDISKEALIAGSKRDRGLRLCVASASRLPVRSDSADIVLNIFSPAENGEFHRILKPGGYLIRALPMEHHLWSLKQAVYDRPYENPPASSCPDGFTPVSRDEVRTSVTLESTEDIQNLFKMTPYYYKTGKADQEKLTRLTELTVELEVVVETVRKGE